MIRLPTEFSVFLSLLNEHEVAYLLIGGYAVAYHGYPRTTADIDIWIKPDEANARKMVAVLQDFGFGVPELKPDLFLNPAGLIRMGVAPLRIEVMMEVPGIAFDSSYEARIVDEIEAVEVSIISLADLKKSKAATGRHKDLDDLEHLP